MPRERKGGMEKVNETEIIPVFQLQNGPRFSAWFDVCCWAEPEADGAEAGEFDMLDACQLYDLVLYTHCTIQWPRK